MNTRLLSLGSLAAILAVATPAVADEAIGAFNPEFVRENTEIFNASTSAESLKSFEVKGEFAPKSEDESSTTEVAQYWNDGTTQKESGFYIGGNIGWYFPTFDDIDTAFGGGGYVGYKFNKNLGTEVEVNYVGGGFSDFDDLDYNVLSILGNVRYSTPLGNAYGNSKWSAFGAVGLGASIVSSDGEINNVEIDESETNFALQIKGGVGYRFNEKLEAFGQLRYINIFSSDNGRLEDGGFFSPELGIQYNF